MMQDPIINMEPLLLQDLFSQPIAFLVDPSNFASRQKTEKNKHRILCKGPAG